MASETRTKILTTAMHLFREKGYGSTSMADILGRAGVNSGSLYHFFPGKQDLLLAVLDAYHDGIKNRRQVDTLIETARAANVNALVVVRSP